MVKARAGGVPFFAVPLRREGQELVQFSVREAAEGMGLAPNPLYLLRYCNH